MAAISFAYSQRIGSKKLAVTGAEDPEMCYTWSILKSGVRTTRYACNGCRSLLDRWKKARVPCGQFLLPIMRASASESSWIDSEPSSVQFCQPKKKSQVEGLGVRRSMQAELASGTNENVASAIVRTEKKLLNKFASESKESLMEQAAIWWWIQHQQKKRSYIRPSHLEEARQGLSFKAFWRYYNSPEVNDLKRFLRMTKTEFEHLYSIVRFQFYAGSGSYAAPQFNYPRPLAYGHPASSGCSGGGGGCASGCCGSSSQLQNTYSSSSSSSSSYSSGGSYAAAPAPVVVAYQSSNSYQAPPFSPSPYGPPPPPIHIATPQSEYLVPPPVAIPPPPPPPPSVVGVISAPASPDPNSNVEEGIDSPYDELNQEHETESTPTHPPAPIEQPEPPAAIAPETVAPPEPIALPATVSQPLAPPGPIDNSYGAESSPPATLEAAAPPAPPAPVAQTPYEGNGSDASVVAAPGTAAGLGGGTDYGDETNSAAQGEDANTGLNCDDSELKSIVEKALQSSSDNLDAARKIESQAAARFGGRFNSIVSNSEFAYVNWYGKRNCQLRVNDRHSLTWED